MNIDQLKSAIIAAGVSRNIIEAGAPVTDETLLNIVACLGMGPKQVAQEPARYEIDYGGGVLEFPKKLPNIGLAYAKVTPLYTHPQPSAPVAQAERHVLTEDQIQAALRSTGYVTHSQAREMAGVVSKLLSTAPQVEQVEAKEGWIDVFENPPKEGSRVLTCDMTDNGRIQLNDFWRHYDSNRGEEGYGATHWMPLPAAPSSQKEE